LTYRTADGAVINILIWIGATVAMFWSGNILIPLAAAAGSGGIDGPAVVTRPRASAPTSDTVRLAGSKQR
jgi:hypothetical protein